jgi:hypothetical protein
VSLGVLAAPALAATEGRGRASACILLYMDGGPSHIRGLKEQCVRNATKGVRMTIDTERTSEESERLLETM